ncbi:MAG: hypothetical protein PHQ22_08640 [Sulfuricurvum sp.]|nr:hypothetical protein [Sulfuricurvum sp.]MDD5387245.1 hypothetical protein [Sulfuricurvum sp.]
MKKSLLILLVATGFAYASDTIIENNGIVNYANETKDSGSIFKPYYPLD